MQITAQAITVDVGRSRLLDRVDLEVRPGELLGLIGPNGAGKTTLLRILAGLRPACGGRVLYDGRSIPRKERPALARRLAYMAQGSDVAWPLRVDRLVSLGRIPHQSLFRRDPAEDEAAVTRALRRVGIEQLRDRSLITLSGGERLQVLLARALAVEGEALLADEPVAAVMWHACRHLSLPETPMRRMPRSAFRASLLALALAAGVFTAALAGASDSAISSSVPPPAEASRPAVQSRSNCSSCTSAVTCRPSATCSAVSPSVTACRTEKLVLPTCTSPDRTTRSSPGTACAS